MRIHSLNDVIKIKGDSFKNGDIETLLHSFSCKNNRNVENFIRYKAINNELNDFTKTYLVLNDDYNLIGYFSITVKTFNFDESISKSVRQEITRNKHNESFNSILIAQLGKNDNYKNEITGSQLLGYALDVCLKVYGIIGLRIASVEYEQSDFLMNFYTQNGFRFLQGNDKYELAIIKLHSLQSLFDRSVAGTNQEQEL